MDRDPEERRQFYTIKTDTGHVLTLTPTHLLYSTSADDIGDDQADNEFVDFGVIYARDVSEGDFVLVLSSGGSLRPSRVVTVEMTVRRGVFAPLTSAGNLVVDNVLASCYALVDSQTVAHASFAPLRWWKALEGALFARDENSVVEATPPEDGIHWYADWLYKVAEVLIPDRIRR